MRNNCIYMILAVVGMLFSCQRIDLPDREPALNPSEGVYGEVTISFSAQIPTSVETKAMGDAPFTTAGLKGDFQSLHLVVFDENGMLVETREAEIITPVDGTHETGRTDVDKTPIVLPEASFKVTLTTTDQPRIIHFIANCPVDQIIYGHEASIISNLYVEKDDDDDTPETAYWARVEFPHLLVLPKKDADGQVIKDANGNILYMPDPTIADKFRCIPMIRNYAQIVVRNSVANFNLDGFAVYNTIDKGTVAPYNKNSQGFQSFTFGTTDNEKFTYPELTFPHLTHGALMYPYEGHALASATLNTDLSDFLGSHTVTEVVLDQNKQIVTDDDGNPVTRTVQECLPYYMYERKVSVRTDQEEMWNESPPHIIIKGQYNGGPTSYYKADLIYALPSADGLSSNRYYNILRNFRYQFTIVKVSGDGYPTVEEAINGAPSNNLSSSTTTTKFTNISDEDGRLFVSYTDTTLVNSNQITLKYKYIPKLNDIDQTTKEPKVDNDQISVNDMIGVRFDGFVDGDVIASYDVAENDIADGRWAGYREITLNIKDVSALTKDQAVVIRTDNPSLSREVRYRLMQPYPLSVECTEEVAAALGAQVEVDVKLPVGLTEDMFPLELDIEIYDMTLSPDAKRNTYYTLPVVASPSIIPLKNGQPTFHYVLTIETKAEYDQIPTADNQKTITTYWLTNISNNASYVYVSNKYFSAAYDYWTNPGSPAPENPFAVFKNLRLSSVPTVTGGDVTLSFSYDDSVTTTRESVTMTLVGLRASGSDSRLTLVSSDASTGTYTYRFTPSDSNLNQEITLQTVSARGDVSVTLQSDSYKPTSRADKTRPYLKFNGSFDQEGPLAPAAHTPVNYTFNVPYAVEEITVTMTGLEPVSSGAVTVEAASTKAAGVPELTGGTNGVYKLKPNGYKGQVTLGLQTSNDTQISGTFTHSIRLSDGGIHYVDDYDEIDQVGFINTTIDKIKVTFKWTWNNAPENNAVSPTVTVAGKSVTGFTITRDGRQGGKHNYTYTVYLNNVKIQNASEEDNVVIQYKSGNRTFTATVSVAELIADPNVTLTAN